MNVLRHRRRRSSLIVVSALAALVAAAVAAVGAGTTQAGSSPNVKGPTFSQATAFDVSRPLSDLARLSAGSRSIVAVPAKGHGGIDRALEKVDGSGLSAASAVGGGLGVSAATALAPLGSFEGISNQDNFNIFGFRVNPPDPVGDVGPNHYVEMANLAYAVYSKTGTLLAGPADTGLLWAGFPITDCTDPSGDPVVVYDQLSDRWLLSQFTTAGPMYYECIAISQTGDPTGAYYRYAFVTQPDPDLPGGTYFPDYPKLGVWEDSYVLTTRNFGDVSAYGIGVYALDRKAMIEGKPDPRVVSFFIDGNDPTLLPLVGDGLLPADLDGKKKPKKSSTIPLVGTQDDNYFYGATSDALNIWEVDVKWKGKGSDEASLTFAAQLPVEPFNSNFPCGVVPGTLPPSSRDCLPQPGITNGSQYIDILSYRQRPTFRLAYRNFGKYESMVTNQSVEAAPGVAGVRWYEIRRDKDVYSVYQQGTYNPGDGIHRWMGSIAQDKKGNMGLGYSVVNGVDVFPGIRFTGRLEKDALGTMGSVGEGTIVDGTGVQRTTNSRWGDYTSMNVDPADDCSFWYVNEYYTLAGQLSSTAGWQTRIASFKLPGCN